jgi:hypothetical protein
VVVEMLEETKVVQMVVKDIPFHKMMIVEYHYSDLLMLIFVIEIFEIVEEMNHHF